jgi:predicted phosphatase
LPAHWAEEKKIKSSRTVLRGLRPVVERWAKTMRGRHLIAALWVWNPERKNVRMLVTIHLSGWS